MTEIGLFPLELVLLPTERVPLHIFEPRYKELIGECLRSGDEFGLMLQDENGRRDVGTCSSVAKWGRRRRSSTAGPTLRPTHRRHAWPRGRVSATGPSGPARMPWPSAASLVTRR